MRAIVILTVVAQKIVWSTKALIFIVFTLLLLLKIFIIFCHFSLYEKDYLSNHWQTVFRNDFKWKGLFIKAWTNSTIICHDLFMHWLTLPIQTDLIQDKIFLQILKKLKVTKIVGWIKFTTLMVLEQTITILNLS